MSMFADICSALRDHSASGADQASVRLVMHPVALDDLRCEMGRRSSLLRRDTGRWWFGKFPIEETVEVDGWTAVSNLTT